MSLQSGHGEVVSKEGMKEKPANINDRDSDKENTVIGEQKEEEESKDRHTILAPREVVRSPFSASNSRQQRKPTTPAGSSRGAMLLNLSRKVLDTNSSSLPPPTPPSSLVTVSPRRPWARYAPSPSHVSPSASILKRPADDMDSSTEESPVRAKRIRLESSTGKRVHFNPVNESVEIPRTPKQQKPRKKLLSALTEPDDKEDEMEGVTSLVMFPQLVENKDSINSVQHLLATGQWVRCLEQDLKKNEINTIGDLAGLDNNAVTKIKGIKPPKQQTVKSVLSQYYARLRREENALRKGSPVQEETSQEEEDRIKEDIFSRPSPSPTDMADPDTSQDGSEQTKDNTEESTESCKEKSSEESNEKSQECEDDYNEKMKENFPSKHDSSTTAETVKETSDVAEEEVHIGNSQAMSEVSEETEEIVEKQEEKVVEKQVDEGPKKQEEQKEVVEKEEDVNENQAEEVVEKLDSEEMENALMSLPNTVNLTEIVSIVGDEEFEPKNLSNADLKILLNNIFEHSKKIEAIKEKAIKTLADRVD